MVGKVALEKGFLYFDIPSSIITQMRHVPFFIYHRRYITQRLTTFLNITLLSFTVIDSYIAWTLFFTVSRCVMKRNVHE